MSPKALLFIAIEVLSEHIRSAICGKEYLFDFPWYFIKKADQDGGLLKLRLTDVPAVDLEMQHYQLVPELSRFSLISASRPWFLIPVRIRNHSNYIVNALVMTAVWWLWCITPYNGPLSTEQTRKLDLRVCFLSHVHFVVVTNWREHQRNGVSLVCLVCFPSSAQHYLHTNFVSQKYKCTMHTTLDHEPACAVHNVHPPGWWLGVQVGDWRNSGNIPTNVW